MPGDISADLPAPIDNPSQVTADMGPIPHQQGLNPGEASIAETIRTDQGELGKDPHDTFSTIANGPDIADMGAIPNQPETNLPLTSLNPDNNQQLQESTPKKPTIRDLNDRLTTMVYPPQEPSHIQAGSTESHSSPNKPQESGPQNETDRKAFSIYESYFGPNWQSELKDTLFMDVRSATNADRLQAGPRVGWVSTAAEATVPDNHVIKNHVIIFNEAGASDYPLRTEVGEALWNLLENAAVTRSLPSNENGVAKGFGNLVEGNVTSETVVDFSAEILDRWNQAYTQKPIRYTGMNPDSPREYNNIPEWKSEGFADAIAVEIRRRSGNPLDAHEQAVWSSLNPHAQGIITASVDAFLPPIVNKIS